MNVTLERRYRAPLSLHPPSMVACGDIDLGSVKTWHGTPDGCVREGIPLVWGRASSWEAEDESDSDTGSVDSRASDGRTTTLEAKIVPRTSDLAQVVGTCVTAAFTEHNLHPRKQPMVPSVLMGENTFRVCFYDCVKDVLIISGEKALATNGNLSQSAMVLLWAVFNHG